MYFPKSQTINNLYTNGEEFITIDSRTPYIGYYWKTSKGKFYTGKTPQDTPAVELIPFSNEAQSDLIPTPLNQNINSYYNQNDNDPIIYLNLLTPTPPASLPTYSLTLPTQQDYQIGEFKRYFCKKTNEIIYLEINKDTYDKLINKNPQILYQLYIPFNIPWQLTGDKTQVYKTNKNMVELTSFRNKFPMLSEYLQNDFTKYYK